MLLFRLAGNYCTPRISGRSTFRDHGRWVHPRTSSNTFRTPRSHQEEEEEEE